mmetsp:Transcript_5237/g.21361  ORF Transcript_5237/g.21361 Transcript_5237/m.21361 type:complete len:211 (-) Transcript_5237:1420-2052(-)
MRRARRPASRRGRPALRRGRPRGPAGGDREGGGGARRMRRRVRRRSHLPRARGPEHGRPGALPGARAEGRARARRPPRRILRRGAPHGCDARFGPVASRGREFPRSSRAPRRRPRRRGRRASVQVRGALPPDHERSVRLSFGLHRRGGLRGAAEGGFRRARGVRLCRDARGARRPQGFAVRVPRSDRPHVGPRGSRGAPSRAPRGEARRR